MPNHHHRNASICFVAVLVLLTACSQLPLNAGPTATPTLTPTPAPSPTSTSAPTPTESPPHGTVKIWHTWDEPEVPALVEIIRTFNQQYPDILFDVLYVPIETLPARFEEASRDGVGPSLLLGPAAWGPDLYAKGLINDVGDLASQTFLERINPAALGSVIEKDALIGLPHSMEGVVLFRNKLIVPQPASTFDELIAQAQQATSGDVIGAVLERSFFFSGAHLNGLGGRLMDENGEPAFNDPSGLEWVQLLKDFELAGPTEYLTDNDIALFRQNRVGWIIDGTWNSANLAEAIGSDRLAIDPWPSYRDGALSGYVRTDNIYLSSQVSEAQRQASWLFMQYLLSADAQKILAMVDHIPVVVDVQVDDPLMAQAMAALAGGSTYPPVAAMDLYSVQLDLALRSIFFNGIDPAQALQSAQDEILNQLAQAPVQSSP